jgi:hypothetical protein
MVGTVASALPMGSRRPYHKSSLAAASIGYNTEYSLKDTVDLMSKGPG